jgi:hypothetical protein
MLEFFSNLNFLLGGWTVKLKIDVHRLSEKSSLRQHSGKHKIVEIKNFDFLFFAILL